MKVKKWTVRDMEKENFFIQMVVYMKVIGNMIKWMEMVLCIIKVEKLHIKVKNIKYDLFFHIFFIFIDKKFYYNFYSLLYILKILNLLSYINFLILYII